MKNNTEPWNITIDERIAELFAARKHHKKVAVILYPEEDKGSSFRYRGYNIYQATKDSQHWQLVYFFLDEIEQLFGRVPDIHLLIFGRITRWSPLYDELAMLAKANDVAVLQDLDDCICGPKYIKEMFNVVSPDLIDQEYWINTCAHYELISYLADGFLVTNDYLGKKLSVSHDGKPYKVIKNFLNQEQINLSAELLNNNITKKDGVFQIGYFSGSHTHSADFEVVYAELLQLLDEYPDIRLKIVGLLKLPESAAKFVKNGQISYSPLVDFLTLERAVAEVDLNIAPLADNTFSNCKSDLKFFEAGLVKTPTVASPTFAFKESIKHNSNGFLCQPGEWHDLIIKLYNNRDLASKIADNAYKFSLENYAPKTCIKQIEEAYNYYAKK